MTENVYNCFVFKSPIVPNGLVSFYLTLHIDSSEMPACGGGVRTIRQSPMCRGRLRDTGDRFLRVTTCQVLLQIHPRGESQTDSYQFSAL